MRLEKNGKQWIVILQWREGSWIYSNNAAPRWRTHIHATYTEAAALEYLFRVTFLPHKLYQFLLVHICTFISLLYFYSLVLSIPFATWDMGILSFFKINEKLFFFISSILYWGICNGKPYNILFSNECHRQWFSKFIFLPLLSSR